MATPTIETPAGRVAVTAAVGGSGMIHMSGQVLEEYDPELRGGRAVKVFDEMRRNEPTIAIGLRAIKWILGQVNWSVQPGGTTPADEEAAAFLDSCREDMSYPWGKLVRDAVTMLDFGFSWLEATYKVRAGPEVDPASRYDDGRIGWRKLTLLGHKSLARWALDSDGGIRGFVQQNQTPGPGQPWEVTVPIEKSVLFRLDDEVNNPEGLSLLRGIYRSWFLKKQIEEIEAVGIERDLAGVPAIHPPVGATETDFNKARDLLEQYSRDEMTGFILPRVGPGDHEGWQVEILGSPGSKGIDTDKVISRYRQEIATNFLAQFLLLGQGSTGSWSLGRDQRDLFEVALGAILLNLDETINRYLVPPLFRFNDFGRLTALPRIVPGRISKADLDKFSRALSLLTQAALLTPDADLERYVRAELDLPEPVEAPEPAPTEDTGSQDETGGQGEGQPPEETGTQQEREAAEPTAPDEDGDLDTADPYDDDAEEDADEVLREIERELGRQASLAEGRRFARAERPRIDLSRQIEATRGRFERRMGDLARDFRERKIGYSEWAARGKVEIQDHVRAGQKLGLAEARGVYPPSKVKLTAAERTAANRMVDEQLRYFSQFRKDVQAKLVAGKELTTAVDVRARLYAGAVRSAATEARLGSEPGQRLRWERSKQDSCSDCIEYDGRVQTAEEWEAGGVWPAHNVTCMGNCGCSLQPAE